MILMLLLVPANRLHRGQGFWIGLRQDCDLMVQMLIDRILDGTSPLRVGTSNLSCVSADQNSVKLPNNWIAAAALGVQRHAQGEIVKR